MRKMHRFIVQRRRQKRREAIKAACPECGAEPGRLCIGKRSSTRQVPHRARFTAPPQLTLVETGVQNDRSTEASLIRAGMEELSLAFEEQFHWMAARCQSPIERLMLAALMADSAVGQTFRLEMMCFKEPKQLPDIAPNRAGCWLIPQVCVGTYRADFIILNTLIQPKQVLVIECDGHDYHERTKEQAAYDKRRDRFFVAEGLTVLHFTGSEIFNNPRKCAEEILGLVRPW